MASDLTVPEGATVILDDNPPPHLAGAFERIQVTSLNDLADLGIIESRNTIDTLLNAAKSATASALTQRETFSPFVAVPGTAKPDFRRQGGSRAGASREPD